MNKTRRKYMLSALLDSWPQEVVLQGIFATQINMLTGWNFPYYKKVANPRNPKDTRCLAVSDNGELFEVWSWNKAIDGYTPRKNMLAAMRSAIQSQLTAYMAKLQEPCAHCGATEDLTVDHVSPPFIKLALNFASRYADFDGNIANDGDGRGWYIAEPMRKRKWQRYHRLNACYQILCRSCNSEKGVNHANQRQARLQTRLQTSEGVRRD